MITTLRMVKADFIKMKNSPFYWIHVCMPIIGIVMFLWYYSFSRLNVLSKIEAYAQAVSIVFPILIGIVCSMVVEQEAMTGGFKEMLGTAYGKQRSLFSKIVLLLVLGFISTSITVGGFFIGFQYILQQNVLHITSYGNIILIIFGSQIFLYLFHIWLSFLWGSGASIGVGIFESLFSALIITGLGDGIWQWIPCGWSIRFCDYFFIKWYNLDMITKQASEANLGIRNSILVTILFGLFLAIWFNSYEGRKEK